MLVDPPYGMFTSLQNRLSTYLPAVLAQDGLVVVETGAREEPELPPLTQRTSRRYGSARISLFQLAPGDRTGADSLNVDKTAAPAKPVRPPDGIASDA